MLPELLCILGIQGVGKAINTQVGKNTTDDYGMYRDGNGNYRLKQNGRKVVDGKDFQGDYVIKYVSDGTTAINITKKEAEKREEEAIKQGKRFYLRQANTGWGNKLGVHEIFGDRYCEVGRPYKYYVPKLIHYRTESGKEYYGEFFMDMKCNLICPTDGQIEKDKERFEKYGQGNGLLTNNNDELYNEIIKEWERYVSNPLLDVKGNPSITLGRTQKRDFKYEREKISKMR